MSEYGRIHTDGSRSGGQPPRHQPTASADAEQVWQEALSAAAMSPRSRGASFDPDQAAAAVIQAYGDARADAARREYSRSDYTAVQKAVAPIILSPDLRATDWESRAIEDVAIAAIHALATRPQPTANVDAEQVWQEAWDAYHGEPWPRSISESEQAIAVIRTAMEAYGDARADAARREALDRIATLEAKLAAKDAQLAEARAENERLRKALRVYAGPMEWTQEGGWGAFPVWADGYPGGVYVDDNTLDYGDAARAALAKIKDATDAD